jgi:two-component system, response regulator
VNPGALPVLLVEDDPNDVFFFQRALGKLGVEWNLEVAKDGDEALRRVFDVRPPPRHMVLDLKIPKKNGLEVLEAIRGRSLDLRVVVLTSSREESDMASATKLGVDRFLIKPVGFPHFLGVVEEIVRAWASGPDSPRALIGPSS